MDPREIAAAVVTLAKTLNFGTQKEIGAELGVDQSTVSRAVKAAVALGLAKSDDEVPALLKRAKDLAKELSRPVGPEVDEEEGEEIDL